MTIWVDGQLLGGSDVPRTKAIAPFETMGARGGMLPLWPLHLQRLSKTAQRLGIDFEPDPELRAAATEVLLTNGHSEDVLRLSLVPDAEAGNGPARVVLDGIVVDSDGALLEAALGNLWLRVQGRWLTPPLDGRVLPGIARAILLERASAAGIAALEQPLTFADLHSADAIAHSNAVYGPRPASLVGEQPAVEIVDSELGALWREATSG